MKKSNDKIKEELRALISRGNQALNASQNKQRITAYLYIIFSLLALSLFGLFAIGPTITTISDLSKQLEENKIALEQLKAKNEALKLLSAEFLDIQDDLDLIDRAIPLSSNIATLTRQIENLTLTNNLRLQKLDTGLMEIYPSENENSPTGSFTITVAVSGDEGDINNFISDLIGMERIISVERLSTGRLSNQTYSAEITGNAYFYNE